MASGGGNRNGTHKLPNLRSSASFKSKLPPSNVRRSIGAVGGADSAKRKIRFEEDTSYDSQTNLIDILNDCRKKKTIKSESNEIEDNNSADESSNEINSAEEDEKE